MFKYSLICSTTLLIGTYSATGATLCVSQGGNGGCQASIQAAVDKAAPNDTVMVGQGVYNEDVSIRKPLSLVGAGAANTTVNANGLANGINVDGHNNSGLSHVVVNGFTVRNANFQGILVTDASFVTIMNNVVTHNDTRLQPFASGGPHCPGLPDYFAAGEGMDCGEGIHLSGVDHSTVVNNVVQNNAGGILISDDTGPNHDNLIAGNTVQDNPFDCGITLASHHFTMTATPDWGVFHNTVSGNVSARNGLATGEGAGIGLFAGPPGARTFSNVVINNTATGNALPGVAMHSHTVMQDLNDNQIVGNRIARNGPDSDTGTTTPTGMDVFSDDAHGAPPITGTVILQNDINNEDIDLAVNTAGSVDAHLNTLTGATGIANLGSGTVNATDKWWGCSKAPGANGCAAVVGAGVDYLPYLSHPMEANEAASTGGA